MSLNTRASGLAPHARAGKDGAMYDAKGNLLATVETFTSQTSFNNAQFQVLGNPLELETVNTHKNTLSMTQIVVMDDQFVIGLVNFFEKGITPNWTFQGVLQGRKNSQGKCLEERWIYKNCIPSGQIDIQNINVGDTVKRQWNFAVNSEPVLQKRIDKLI